MEKDIKALTDRVIKLENKSYSDNRSMPGSGDRQNYQNNRNDRRPFCKICKQRGHHTNQCSLRQSPHSHEAVDRPTQSQGN